MTGDLDCVVAIPAMNEAERIGLCLEAVLDQRQLDGAAPLAKRWVVAVFANNCADGTAAIARGFGDRVLVVEAALAAADSHAGGARSRAMEHAAFLLGAGSRGLICTTDADSRPRPDWLAHLFAGVAGGAEAVAGAVDFDPADRPVGGFGRDREREAIYSPLQAEIDARADPQGHNPWPNHQWAWGANLAVTASAYRRVGGMPQQPLAEDRAFVERLKLFDVPVRHCLSARVWTSARRVGRAPGGLASLVDDHLGDDSEACDAALEPAATALLRATQRRRFRLAYAAGARPETWLKGLGVDDAAADAALDEPTFGEAWRRLEAAIPALARRRLHPSDLGREIRAARRILNRLATGGPGDRSDRIRAASAGLWSSAAAPP